MDQPTKPALNLTRTVPLEQAQAESTTSSSGGSQLDDGEGKDRGRFSPGTRLAGRFQVTRWIANGGMGEVYEARDLELGELIAVKIIRPEIARDERVMDRFRREISLARQVTHPNVCRLFDVFFHTVAEPESAAGSSAVTVESASQASAEGEQIALLTMELLEGRTLSDYLSETGTLDPERALPIVRQMVAALSAAHEAGVVHRDFKCSNVMIVERQDGPRVVVTDFGLAHSEVAGPPSKTVTQQGEILGSPAYMAPEQALGVEITAAADIYSLGVVIYRMLTGRMPFDAPTSFATLALRLNEAPTPPREVVTDLDPRWNNAIMRCLARDPRERYPAVGDLLDELQLKSTEPTLSDYGRPFSRPVAVGALVVLVGVGLAFFASNPEGDAPPTSSETIAARSSVAVIGFHNLSEQADKAWLSTALAELLTSELAADERLRLIPGENVARMKLELNLDRIEGMATDTLARVGRHLGSSHLITGSYLAVGEGRLRLSLQMQSTETGETLTNLNETTSEAELLTLVDRLSDSLRRDLSTELEAGAPTDARPSLPSNARALRLYTEGLERSRAFDDLGARDLLLQSVDADPEFPLAYAALAGTYSTLGYELEAVEQIRSAFKLSRSSIRQERLVIEGQYRALTGDWGGAADSYRALFEAFPDELEYGLRLVETQSQAGLSADAEETLQAVRRLLSSPSEEPRVDLAEHHLAMVLAQYPRALKAAGRAVDKSRELGALQLKARASLLKGKALRVLGRLKEAESAAQEAAELSLDLGDRNGTANALDLVGTVRFYQGSMDSSLEAHEQALAIYREIGSRSGMFSVLNNKAITLFTTGDLAGAVKLREEALSTARVVGIKRKVAGALANLAVSYLMLGENAKALKLQEESLDIARQIGNPQMIGRRLYSIGLIWLAKDLNSARERLEEAYIFFSEIDDSADKATTLRALANVDIQQGDFAAARSRLNASAEISKGQERVLDKLETRHYLAILALEEQRFQEAGELADELAQELRELRRAPYEAETLSVVATARIALGEVQATRQALQRITELLPKENIDGLSMHFAAIEARLLAAEGKPKEALALLSEELIRLIEAGRKDQQFSARLAMGEIELENGQESSGRQRLTALAQDATAAGFHLIARKARELSEI